MFIINQVQAHALPSDVWGVILSGSSAKELSNQSQVSKLFYAIIGGEGFREVWQRETHRHYPNKVHFKFMTKENDWRVAFLRFAMYQVNLTRRDREPSDANQLLWAKSHIDGIIHYMWELRNKDDDRDEAWVRYNCEAFQLLKSFEISKGSDSKVPTTTELEIHYYLGLCYEKGIGVDQDGPTAIDYHSKASEKNFLKSKFRMGFIFEHSTDANVIKAYQNYKSAADLGHAMAQCNTGFCYYRGLGTNVDLKNAYNYFKMAAEQGHTLGQALVGLCYEKGIGITADPQKAFDYYSKSAAQGNILSQGFLSTSAQVRDGDKVILARMIDAHFPILEECLECCWNSGCSLAKAMGSEIDILDCYKFYDLFCNYGHPMAQCILGARAVDDSVVYQLDHRDDSYFNYEQNLQIVKNLLNDAYGAFEEAAFQGFGLGQLLIGKCFMNGNGVEGNKELALQYLHLAASQGYPSAYYQLYYIYSRTCVEDIDKAIKYLHLAADQGNADACSVLGDRYSKGIGVEMDIDKAIYYFEKAVQEGMSHEIKAVETLKKRRLEDGEYPTAK